MTVRHYMEKLPFEGDTPIPCRHDVVCEVLLYVPLISSACSSLYRYYRVLSKALLGFSVPDNQPSMTAHYKPNYNPIGCQGAAIP